jgi:hypothetical protein
MAAVAAAHQEPYTNTHTHNSLLFCSSFAPFFEREIERESENKKNKRYMHTYTHTHLLSRTTKGVGSLCKY